MQASFCGNCGQPFQSNETFCAKCGTLRDSHVSDTATMLVTEPSIRSRGTREPRAEGVSNLVPPTWPTPERRMKIFRSKRARLVGLVSATILILAFASGITWFTLHHAAPAGGITEFPLPKGNYNYSVGITTGSDGNLWFTMPGSGQIGRITPSGSITEFPLPTRQQGPVGITAGPDGNLWFTECIQNTSVDSCNDSKIGRITPNGAITEFPLPNSNSGPIGITAGPDHNLWFTEYFSNRIGRITPNGPITEFPLPAPLNGPSEITSGPDGDLWFTMGYSNRIGRITSNGSITSFSLPASNGELSGITAGPDGNLWFTDDFGNQIGRITPKGAIAEFSLPSKSNPIGITEGPDGNLWFTQSESGQIGRITPSGSITEFSLSPSRGPGGITAGPDGNLWFTEEAGDKIGRITSGT